MVIRVDETGFITEETEPLLSGGFRLLDQTVSCQELWLLHNCHLRITQHHHVRQYFGGTNWWWIKWALKTFQQRPCLRRSRDGDLYFKSFTIWTIAGKRAAWIEMSFSGCSYMLRQFLSHAMNSQMKQFTPITLHETPQCLGCCKIS